MTPPLGLDGVRVEFDDERAVADAGVALVPTLAQWLGIEALREAAAAIAAGPRTQRATARFRTLAADAVELDRHLPVVRILRHEQSRNEGSAVDPRRLRLAWRCDGTARGAGRLPFAVTFVSVARNWGCARLGRSSLATPSGGPPGAHRGGPLRALPGELRDRPAPLPPAADGGCRRAGARQLAPAGPARVRGGGADELQRLPARAVRLRTAAELLARQPAHFAKAFRRRYGPTPAQCRGRAAVNETQRRGGRRR